MVAALYPAERNADRESSYLHCTDSAEFPKYIISYNVKEVTKFEHLNVSINVYGIEG